MRELLLLAIGLLFIKHAHSQVEVKPFQTHNQSPLIHFFGLPANAGGSLLAKNQISLSSWLNIANNATSSQYNNEAIYLDGEMYRNEFIFSYGLFSKLEASVQIPFIRHSSGFMDRFIGSWHSTFNSACNRSRLLFIP